MLEDILPKDYLYRIETCSVIDDQNFHCETRCNINNEEDFKKWLKEFEFNSNTSWILRRSVPKENSSFLFSRNYICHHSSYRKKQVGGKNKNCTASLTARIKRNSRFTHYRDPLLKDGFYSIIKINFHHSHKINAEEAMAWLPRSEETKQIFIELFNSGMTPTVAKNYHETLILSECPEQLANSRVNPPVRWIYFLYENWARTLRSNGESSLKHADEKSVSNNDLSEAISEENGQTKNKHDILHQFHQQMKRIETLVKMNDDNGILTCMENFCKRASNIKSVSDLYNFFQDQAVSYSEQKNGGKLTSVNRKRKALQIESSSYSTGKPLNVIYLKAIKNE